MPMPLSLPPGDPGRVGVASGAVPPVAGWAAELTAARLTAGSWSAVVSAERGVANPLSRSNLACRVGLVLFSTTANMVRPPTRAAAMMQAPARLV